VNIVRPVVLHQILYACLAHIFCQLIECFHCIHNVVYRAVVHAGLGPNSTTRTPLRTPPTDELTTILQLVVVQQSHHQHLDMSRRWALALRCGKFIEELL